MPACLLHALASLLFLIATLFFSTSAFSQGRTIQGTVQTEQGKPIYGATVIVQNTTLGTTTDADGKFSIKLDAGTQPVLQISFIGYETQTVPAAGKTQVEVASMVGISQAQVSRLEKNAIRQIKKAIFVS